MSEAPLLEVALAAPAVDVSPLPGGAVLLASPTPLAAYPEGLGVYLRRWTAEAPERVFLAERRPEGSWRRLTYADTRARVEGLAQSLLDRGAGPDRPVMILSENGIDHGILSLAAMYVGIPVAPISPAYSLMSHDFARLKHVFAKLEPRIVYVTSGRTFASALGALDLSRTELVVSADPPVGRRASIFSDLVATTPTAAVERAQARVGPDTLAKVLFTSGSTGMPKGVTNTNRMMCSNQQALVQVWPFLEHEPPIVVDWLPWSHTFGGNHIFNLVLRNGGTLYVDAGKPVPGRIETTIENLRRVSPTVYFNVPRGFDVLLPYLERDTELRDRLFARLSLIFYAGAALPPPLWERIEKAAIEATGKRVPIVSAWGCTETSPIATCGYFAVDGPGNVGLPLPGCEIKLAPDDGKLELRVRGPNVTPGYWKDPELTAAAFDEDGFYRSGDAGRLADAGAPEKGLAFDGRLLENFSLMSGTWVQVGTLRVAVVAATTPVIQDAVVVGPNRDDLGLLAFASRPGCLSLCGDVAKDSPLSELIAHPTVRDHVRQGLARHNAAHPGNSTRIRRVLLLATQPSIDDNEITDKGYLNQRAVMERRAALVEQLYGDDPEVIRID